MGGITFQREWLVGHGFDPCPTCGAARESIDYMVDHQRSQYLHSEFMRPADRAGQGCADLFLGIITFGLWFIVVGMREVGSGAVRLAKAQERQTRIIAESKECARMTCRICNQQWFSMDWDAVKARVSEEKGEAQ